MPAFALSQLPSPPPYLKGWPWNEGSSELPNTQNDKLSGPLVSIVTPSFNQSRFIEATIRSVLLQGYPNLEYIIIDGASSDGSVEIIKKYADQLAYWESTKDKGQAHAINKGFAKASGEIFAWLNSDDILLPGAVNHIVQLYQQNPLAVAWVGGCHRIDSNGRLLNTIMPKELQRDSLADWGMNYFYQPSCFFAAWAWQEIKSLEERWHYAFDVDLWLRLSLLGEFVSTPRILSAATIHKEAKTQAHRAKMYAEIMSIQIKHGYQEAASQHIARLLEVYGRQNLIFLLAEQVKALLRRLTFWKRNPVMIHFPPD